MRFVSEHIKLMSRCLVSLFSKVNYSFTLLFHLNYTVIWSIVISLTVWVNPLYVGLKVIVKGNRLVLKNLYIFKNFLLYVEIMKACYFNINDHLHGILKGLKLKPSNSQRFLYRD